MRVDPGFSVGWGTPLSGEEMVLSGGSRIFQTGVLQLPTLLLCFKIFAENCMKMKDFGPRGGGTRPWRPLPIGSANGTAPTYTLGSIYSTIHKAAGSLVTGRSQKTAGWNAPQRWFLLVAPIDSQWTLLCSTGIVPVNIMERPGTVGPAAL